MPEIKDTFVAAFLATLPDGFAEDDETWHRVLANAIGAGLEAVLEAAPAEPETMADGYHRRIRGLPRHFKVGDKVRRRRDSLDADGSEAAIIVDVEMIGGREMVTARFLNHRETFLWDAYELIVGLPTIEG